MTTAQLDAIKKEIRFCYQVIQEAVESAKWTEPGEGLYDKALRIERCGRQVAEYRERIAGYGTILDAIGLPDLIKEISREFGWEGEGVENDDEAR